MIVAFPALPIHLLISGHLLRNPDNSNPNPANSNFFSISLEGSSYRKSTIVEKLKTFVQMIREAGRSDIIIF